MERPGEQLIVDQHLFLRGPRARRAWRWLFPCVWLVYLAAPVAAAAEQSSRRALGSAAIALAVGALYLWSAWTSMTPLRGRLQAGWRTPVAMIALIALASVALDHGWLGAMVYATVALSMVLDARLAVRAIGATAVLTGWLAFAEGVMESTGFVAVLQALMIGLATTGLRQLVRSNRELREARAELARLAVDQERLRFARDLHDLLGHSLSLIALKSELAGRLIGHDPQRAKDEVADIERVTRSALAEVRDAVAGYRQPSLDTELAGARVALSAAELDCHLERHVEALPEDVDRALAWAVREGVTNVLRHAGARACTIAIEQEDEWAVLAVRDDGAGPGDGDGRGSGLAGLAERVAQRGGELVAGRRPEGGFELRVRLPLAGGAA